MKTDTRPMLELSGLDDPDRVRCARYLTAS